MQCGRVERKQADAIRKDFNILLIHQDKKFFISELFRVIQDALQDNVLIPNNFFENIYHIECAINLHSITNSGLIPGGQNLSKERQTVFFTAVGPMNKEQRDPINIDLEAPRQAQYTQKAWKKHQKHCVLGRHNTNTIERNHPLRHTPSLLYPKSYYDGNWRNHLRERKCVTSTSSKDFL